VHADHQIYKLRRSGKARYENAGEEKIAPVARGSASTERLRSPLSRRPAAGFEGEAKPPCAGRTRRARVIIRGLVEPTRSPRRLKMIYQAGVGDRQREYAALAASGRSGDS
jgi:hypothetical protein